MPEPTSIAVESARRAARSALSAPGDALSKADALAALHHTLSDEARTRGVELAQRIDGLTRALAIEISVSFAHPANHDAARLLLRNAHLLAVSQLEILLALPPKPTGVTP